MGKVKVKYDFTKYMVAPYKGDGMLAIDKGSCEFDYHVWSDGGCEYDSSTGIGSAAYVVLKDGKEIKRNSKGFSRTTNNRMELMAAISGVLSTEDGASVLVHTDSQYIIYMLTKEKLKDDAQNKDILIKWINEWKGNRRVAFEWVKGHDGNPLNELCDCLCVQRIKEMKR